MTIGFDKRLELLYGILYCVNKDMNNTINPGLFIEEMPTYCNEFYELYKKVGISDEFIELIKNHGINSSYAAPAVMALSLDENYNIIENNSLLEMVVKNNPYYDKEKIERNIKEFVEKSNYETFYQEHSDFYKNIVEEYKKSMSEFNVFNENVFEEFYGYKLGEMKINLYNFTTGSSGLLIGDKHYYNQRVDNINEDENNFKFKIKLNNIFHEFSHPYITPLVENFCSNLNLDNLYMEVKKSESYTNAYQELTQSYKILHEYIVRSIALYLQKKYDSKENIENRIEKEKKKGFIHVDEIASIMDDRTNYNNFEEFFKNELIPYFIQLNNNMKTKSR